MLGNLGETRVELTSPLLLLGSNNPPGMFYLYPSRPWPWGRGWWLLALLRVWDWLISFVYNGG